jgi:ATPase subunit of ABC transporter with duplicated ATPase domains
VAKRKRKKKKSKKSKKIKRRKSKKIIRSKKKSRRVKKVRKSKKRRKSKSKSRKTKPRKFNFKPPKLLEDGDGKSLIKVSDSWANHAYVNESKYKKKYKLSIKEINFGLRRERELLGLKNIQK